MIDIFLNFIINIFANTANILPETSTISKLLELFKDDGFIPNTVHEIGPQGPKLRLRMSSPDNKWNIVFLSQNIHIGHIGTPYKNGNEVDVFLNTAREIATKIFQYLDQRSNRLAFVVNAMLKETPKEKLESFYKKLFTPLSIYDSNPPFEWNNRSVSREEISLANTSEAVNIITEIKRVQGQMVRDNKPINFDRIQLDYEFNTAAENKETRFSAGQLESFMDIAKETYNRIITDLEGVLND